MIKQVQLVQRSKMCFIMSYIFTKIVKYVNSILSQYVASIVFGGHWYTVKVTLRAFKSTWEPLIMLLYLEHDAPIFTPNDEFPLSRHHLVPSADDHFEYFLFCANLSEQREYRQSPIWQQLEQHPTCFYLKNRNCTFQLKIFHFLSWNRRF